jgi:hypothetical protein
MKKFINRSVVSFTGSCLALVLLCCGPAMTAFAQDEGPVIPEVKKVKPVKNTFESAWLMDNQTVMVPIKGTLEMDIQHRFGTMDKGKKDVWGIFAPSNIRIGFSYSPLADLFVGAGITKERTQIDLNAKYAILKQTKNKMPVSVTYFGNWVIDARDKSLFRHSYHRYSFFNQLIVARKVTEHFSVQVAPSLSWYNNVEAYIDSKGVAQKKMKNEHLAISV